MKRSIFMGLVVLLSMSPFWARAEKREIPPQIEAAKDLVFLFEAAVVLNGSFYLDRYGKRDYKESISTGVSSTAFQISSMDILSVEHGFLDVFELARAALAQSRGNWEVHGIHVGYWPERIDSVDHVFQLTAADGTTLRRVTHFSALWTGDEPTEENIEMFIESIWPSEDQSDSEKSSDFLMIERDERKDMAVFRLAEPRERDVYFTLPSMSSEVDLNAMYWGLSAKSDPRCDPFCYETWPGKIFKQNPEFSGTRNENLRELDTWHLKMIARPGDSGGPVVDENLTLLGLTVAGDLLTHMIASYGCIPKTPEDRFIISTDEINVFLDGDF